MAVAEEYLRLEYLQDKEEDCVLTCASKVSCEAMISYLSWHWTHSTCAASDTEGLQHLLPLIFTFHTYFLDK